MTAMPSEPPTWRMLLMTAEPTPALSTGTDPIAAAVVGVIVRRHPDAAEKQARDDVPEVESASSWANISSEPVSSSIPAPISQREPTRSENFPAIGATNMISTVIGRNIAPVWIARVAEDALEEERVEEEDPEHREADQQHHGVRARERSGSRNSERSSIGRRWCSSSSDEGAERDRGEGEHRQDERRSPGVMVRLDQRVRQREQPDPGGAAGPGRSRRCSSDVSRRLVDEEARGDDPDRSRSER